MSSRRIAEEPDPELLAYTRRIIEALQWTGLAMVEFRCGPDRAVLLEVNGRIWGSIALPVRAGMDFPTLLLQHTVPELGPPACSTPRVGMVVTHLELELRWLLLAIKDRLPGGQKRVRTAEIARTILALANPRSHFDVQVADDWRVGVYDLLMAVRSLGSSVVPSRELVSNALQGQRNQRGG